MADWTFQASGPLERLQEIATRLEPPLEELGLANALTEDSEDRWTLTVYAPEDAREAVRSVLLQEAPELPFRKERLEAADWVALSLEGLTAVRAGGFVVHGSHERALARSARDAIEIEAGEAFGTGHHGTTAGCLEMIEMVLRTGRPRTVLDLGTGSGVLAIALAKRLRRPVLATDIDPVSVRVARDNARLNRVSPLVGCEAATGLQSPSIRRARPFDLVVANILAGPLIALAPSITASLSPGGSLILSGLLDRQARSVRATYLAHGMRKVAERSREGWTTLLLRR